jgi:hypothetical protein
LPKKKIECQISNSESKVPEHDYESKINPDEQAQQIQSHRDSHKLLMKVRSKSSITNGGLSVNTHSGNAFKSRIKLKMGGPDADPACMRKLIDR